LDGGQTIQTENWNTERLVWIRGGADNITVKNYTVGHLYHDDSYSGAIVMRSPTLSQEIPIVGTTISNVTVDNTSTGNSCGTSSAAGCASLGLVISNTTVQGLTVENSRFTYAAGITIDDISAVNNFTVANSEFSESSGISIKDVPAVSGLAVNGSKFSNSSELSIDDCHVTDWQVENSSFASSSPVSIKDGVISNWVVGNSNFANASGISIDGDSVTDWQVENSSFANASGISSSGADVTRLTVTQSRFSDSSPLHLLASGLTTRVQLHSIKVDNSDFESSSGIRLRRAFFTGLEVLDSRFSYFTSGAEVIDVADGIGANPQLDIRGNTFKNIGSGTAAGDAVIRLPEGQTMGAASHISGNVFDNSDSALTQGYAINYDAGISSNNSTTASNLFIEDNYFDGYTKVGVKLEGTGTATVRRNTFGVNHANAYQNTSKPTTENEETADSNKASMFQNHDKTANRKILTWYPKRAEVVNGCQLAVDLLKPVSGNLPSEPVTIDFYYTAGTTAEEYLGSVDVESPEASGGKNVIVPNLPSRADGYIRVQTQGYSAAGQPESSQYSRTVALPKDDLSACAITGAAIELRAWRGVGADSTYDGIVNGGLAQEIPAGGPLAPGETVWFTYTVRNTGTVLLQQVVVKDQFADPVCIIASIKAGEEAGCSASRPVPA
jgi:hypothetical protein